MRRSLIAALAACVAAPVGAQNVDQSDLQELLSLPPSEIVGRIEVQGDSLDPEIKISTYNVIAPKVKTSWLTSSRQEHSFLRAYIDRKTGEIRAQIYHIASYGGRGWHHFRRATFEGPEGLVEVSVLRAGTDVNCHRYGCSYVEEIVIPVDYSVLSTAAAQYDPNNPAVGIKYRLFGQSGERVDEGVPINEIVAFVDTVDATKTQLKITP